MGARTKSRKRALDLLFEADQRGVNVEVLLAERLAHPVTPAPVPEYAVALVEGVVRNWTTIESVLGTYSHGWAVERMPAVDRAILRIGAYELLFGEQIPDAVAISEAVNLAKDLSTDGSPAFVNGLLGRITEVKDTVV